jgi:dihydrofolate reductase
VRISLIVAMDRNGLIGTQAGLPWRLPADLRRFRKLTSGHPIIMGRKTLEHIGGPLKERLNIVMSRGADRQSVLRGCVIANSLDEAMRLAREASPPMRTDEVFVIGGAEVFQQAMPLIERAYLTIVEGEFTGNTWFPFDEPFQGTIGYDETLPADAKNPHPHRFVIIDRVDGGTTIRDLLGEPLAA